MLQTFCKHWALRKISYKIPPGGGKPYPASGLHALKSLATKLAMVLNF